MDTTRPIDVDRLARLVAWYAPLLPPPTGTDTERRLIQLGAALAAKHQRKVS